VTISLARSSTASLLFNQDLGLEEWAEIVRAFVGHANLDRLPALIARRGIKVEAVAAGVEIRSTVLALVGSLDLIRDLNLRGAVVASCDQMETRLDAATRAPGARRRFGFPFAVTILIAGLTIFSIHCSPS